MPAGERDEPRGVLLEGAAGERPGEPVGGGQLAQFQLVHRDLRELTQDRLLLGAEFARLATDGAQRADIVAVGRRQRHAGIKADMGVAGDHRIVPEAGILAGIAHHHRPVPLDRDAAEGIGKRHLGDPDAVGRLVPLAVAINHRDDGGVDLEDQLDQRGDTLEGGFAGGIEHVVALQRCEPRVRALRRDLGGRVEPNCGGYHGSTSGGSCVARTLGRVALTRS